MRIAAVACSVVLVVFTCFVLVTEGASSEGPYLVLTLLLLLAPILSVFVLLRAGAMSQEGRRPGRPSSMITLITCGAVLCNLVLLGFSCWAILAQYPHPEEDGVVAFAVLAVVVPIVNSVALLGSAGTNGEGRQGIAAQQQ